MESNPQETSVQNNQVQNNQIGQNIISDQSSGQSAQENKPKEHENKIISPKINLPKLQFKKITIPKISGGVLKAKFQEYLKVLKVAKKPDSEEFKTIVKASGLGMLAIGLIGFIIAVIIQIIGFK